MMLKALTSSVLLALLVQANPAHAQYTAKDWPEGPMKQRFAETCGLCHDINRIRVGYTPEGWLTVVRMMQNFDAPITAEEWPAMTEYLIKNFPERPRPPAVIIAGPVKARIDCGTCRRKARARTIRAPPKTARSGGPASSPTSSAASTPRPARSANTR